MLTSRQIIDTLAQYRRAWFDLDGRGAVYLRFGNRSIDGVARASLDLAVIDVNELQRGKGVFSEAVALCERTARESGRSLVYVECIHNPIVSDALARRGYTVHGGPMESTAFKVLT